MSLPSCWAPVLLLVTLAPEAYGLAAASPGFGLTCRVGPRSTCRAVYGGRSGAASTRRAGQVFKPPASEAGGDGGSEVGTVSATDALAGVNDGTAVILDVREVKERVDAAIVRRHRPPSSPRRRRHARRHYTTFTPATAATPATPATPAATVRRAHVQRLVWRAPRRHLRACARHALGAWVGYGRRSLSSPHSSTTSPYSSAPTPATTGHPSTWLRFAASPCCIAADPRPPRPPPTHDHVPQDVAASARLPRQRAGRRR